MKFITTDGKVIIDENSIKQIRLNQTRRYKILVGFLFIIFLVIKLIEKINNFHNHNPISSWIGIILNSILLLFALLLLFEFIFYRVWKSEILISNIVSVSTGYSENNLETHVTIKTKSKRYKIIQFRKLENQAEAFIQAIKSIYPQIKEI